jgi:Uma2 family endonuclease
METARRLEPTTREAFFPWRTAQRERYEFDGSRPVRLAVGTGRHDRIRQALQAALAAQLGGTGCEVLGPQAGLGTLGEAVRYPDAVVTGAPCHPAALLVHGVVAAFEIVCPESGRTDRIDKLREYGAVDSILHYVILEDTGPAITSFERESGEQPWLARALTEGESLRLPVLGLEIPVGAFYLGVTFPASDGAS